MSWVDVPGDKLFAPIVTMACRYVVSHEINWFKGYCTKISVDSCHLLSSLAFKSNVFRVHLVEYDASFIAHLSLILCSTVPKCKTTRERRMALDWTLSIRQRLDFGAPPQTREQYSKEGQIWDLCIVKRSEGKKNPRALTMKPRF